MASEGAPREMDEDFLLDPAEHEFMITRRERLYRKLDRYLLAPARVAAADWRTVIGLSIIAFFILVGTVGVWIVPEPRINEAEPFVWAFQSLEHPLGTDRFGQPIHKQLVHATPAMLKMALAGVIFSVGIAVIVGTLSGYKSGAVDYLLMTVSDVLMIIPGLPLVIVIVAVWQPRDPFLIGAVLAIDAWPGLARMIRSQVLTIREEAYVEANRAMGVRTRTILANDVIPQLMPYVTINAASAARGVIFASVALYFLAFLPFSEFNWGVMMNLAHTQGGALAAPERAGHWLYAPMFCLILLSFGLILFSQGMDRVFNPRLRARHAKTVMDDE